jgi:hypothetical protein
MLIGFEDWFAQLGPVAKYLVIGGAFFAAMVAGWYAGDAILRIVRLGK